MYSYFKVFVLKLTTYISILIELLIQHCQCVYLTLTSYLLSLLSINTPFMYIIYIVFDTYKFITKEREGGGRALLSLSLTEFAVMLKNTKDALKKHNSPVCKIWTRRTLTNFKKIRLGGFSL